MNETRELLVKALQELTQENGGSSEGGSGEIGLAKIERGERARGTEEIEPLGGAASSKGEASKPPFGGTLKRKKKTIFAALASVFLLFLLIILERRLLQGGALTPEEGNGGGFSSSSRNEARFQFFSYSLPFSRFLNCSYLWQRRNGELAADKRRNEGEEEEERKKEAVSTTTRSPSSTGQRTTTGGGKSSSVSPISYLAGEVTPTTVILVDHSTGSASPTASLEFSSASVGESGAATTTPEPLSSSPQPAVEASQLENQVKTVWNND